MLIWLNTPNPRQRASVKAAPSSFSSSSWSWGCGLGSWAAKLSCAAPRKCKPSAFPATRGLAEQRWDTQFSWEAFRSLIPSRCKQHCHWWPWPGCVFQAWSHVVSSACIACYICSMQVSIIRANEKLPLQNNILLYCLHELVISTTI